MPLTSASDPCATTEPAVDDDDVVGEALGLLERVGGDHDGAARGPRLAHQVPDVEAGVRVQPGGRLVQEDHLGAPDEGGGERHPLSLAAGEPADGRAGERGRCRAGRRARRPAPGRRTGRRGGAAAAPGGCRWAARRPAASRPTRARWSAAARQGSTPSTRTVPAVGTLQALGALDRRGLAGAVGAEHGGDLPGGGRPRHAVDARDGCRNGAPAPARSRPASTLAKSRSPAAGDDPHVPRTPG